MLINRSTDIFFGHANPDIAGCAVFDRYDNIVNRAFIRRQYGYRLAAERGNGPQQRFRHAALEGMRQRAPAAVKNQNIAYILAAGGSLSRQLIKIVQILHQDIIAAGHRYVCRDLSAALLQLLRNNRIQGIPDNKTGGKA